ncbi:outer membrane protein OmpW [Salmonella enterica subsp. enterica serovar Choleraesuis]|nr:outer membrane protein OmpW [Salmonella enterica subsp. enterica serovar Choleraesuis]
MKKLSVALLALGAFSASVPAHEAGEFFMRAGTATVRPSESSKNVLGLGEFKVDNNTQMGLTFTYMATDNIGIELLAATPFHHKVGLPGINGSIASVNQLPPTLVAQWYFGDAKSTFRPYIGAGVNYTMFFDEKFNHNGHRNGLSDLSLSNSWGVAGVVGADYMINKDWLINASVWYIDLDTDVSFKAGGQHQSYNLDVNPWVFMFSAGYRF